VAEENRVRTETVPQEETVRDFPGDAESMECIDR